MLYFKGSLRIDDALDVSSVHGVTGVVGSLLAGVYASSSVNPDGPDGFMYSHSLDQLRLQTIGVLTAALLSAVGTWIIMKVIACTLGTTRIEPEGEAKGLDRSQHGEVSYSELTALV